MIILIRHGQSSANEQGLMVGRTDVELTDRGRAQARALAAVLDGTELVLTSPLRRARETAALALPQLKAVIDEAFIEQDYGTLDGVALSEVPADEWSAFRSSRDAALGGGESLAQVDQRVHERLVELSDGAQSLAREPHRHLVIFSHVSPIKSAVTWSLGVPGSTAWRLRLDNASLTTIGIRDGSPYLVRFNDASARHRGGDVER